jgi:sugar lactone lactonase YvrE
MKKIILLLFALLMSWQINAQVTTLHNITGYTPTGSAYDSNGNLFITTYAGQILKITSTGAISVFAGVANADAYLDGNVTVAKFYRPYGIAIDSNNNLFVADNFNSRIRKITPTGTVSTFVGNGQFISEDGTGTAAKIMGPTDIVIDSNNNLYFTERGNKVRKITPAGVVTTIAGTGVAGSADGVGTVATFKQPYGLTITSSGDLYIADTENNKIRKVTSAGIVTTVAGTGTVGAADGNNTTATFNSPYGLTRTNDGTIYVADYGNHKIRRIDSTGNTTTFAGLTSGFVNGTLAVAKFNNPESITINSNGDLLINDFSNQKIRKIDASTLFLNTFFNSKLSIYPNPSNAIFTIDIDSNATIEVFDLVGKQILTKKIELGTTQLDMSNYTTGMYLLKVTNADNQTKTMKIVKQ